ncbi:MAG: ribonuclease H-like domain-containing protein [Planctomycetes bacterium]|nr:ribonuclease H-like domain-containing protein [Planctomycetota bacterium]
MLTDTIRARLADLNREALPGSQAVAIAAARGDRPSRRRKAALEDIAPGRKIENDSGTYYLIEQPLGQLWPLAERFIEDKLSTLQLNAADDDPPRPELAAFAEHFPQRVMYLDLETCGFAGSMVFLIGLVCWDGKRLVLRQLFARDYSQEAAIMQALWQTAAECRVLSTFNGKSFDWPMIHDRSTVHHLGIDCRAGAPAGLPSSADVSLAKPLGPRDPRPELVHFDLLHHSRRRWKDVLPNCKLQTLERFICGRRRTGDIPGEAIPAAYHQFVRSGDARGIKAILHHNALDLVTLLQLSLALG